MKNTLRGLFVPAIALFLSPVSLLAQKEPLLAVDITEINVRTDTGSVVTANITNAGSGYTDAPVVTVSGGGGSGAQVIATLTSTGTIGSLTVVNGGVGYTTPPSLLIAPPGTQAAALATVAGGEITAITVSNGGSGYSAVPAVTLTGGGGTGAAVTAVLANGVVTGFTITARGAGYTSPPNVTIAPPGTTATAVVTALGTAYRMPFQNESWGPYRVPIIIRADAYGTYPLGGFTYTFYVNGEPLGVAANTQPPGGGPAFIAWMPPQPGSYLITVKVTDGAHNVESLPVRYFATGTAVIGPSDNSLVPIGSSVVVQATATPPPSVPNAFVQRMEFYVDGALVGTDNTYPYSYIYKPQPTPQMHVIEARGFDNNGNQISPNGAATNRLQMVTAIGSPPVVRIVNPPSNSSISSGTEVTIIADAVSANGFIKVVDFYLNGVFLTQAPSFPFTTKWTPRTPGRYEFVAIGSDDKSNAVASDPIVVQVTGAFPTAAIVSPAQSGVSITQGAVLPVTVTAAGPDGGITSLSKIEFLVDGAVNDTLPKPPVIPPGADPSLIAEPVLTEPFVFNWKSNVAVGPHRLSVRVTDKNALSISSAEVVVNVVPNRPPSATLVSPTPTTPLALNAAATLSATATDPDGTIANVEFFVNGASVGTANRSPFQVTWTPSVAGIFTLTARATDNAGAATTSEPVRVTVDPGSSPTVSMTAPGDGSLGRVGTSMSLAATASDSDGSVTSVQFFANGVAIAAPITQQPYRSSWTPNAEGIFRLTATAIDSAGNATTSTPVHILVVGTNAIAGDATVTGNYQGTTETGRFAAVNVGGKTAAVIAYSTSNPGKVYLFSALPVDAASRFSGTEAGTNAAISGTFSDTGLTAALDGNRAMLIGTDTRFGAVPTPVPPYGYYTGNLSGRSGSNVAVIVGQDGSVTMFVSDGTFRDAGTSSLAPDGAFAITTLAGNRFTGRATASTGIITGNLTGGPGGAFTAAMASGAAISDGFLRNLSTRGQVGTGQNILIAGFVVGGTSQKRILVRAIGPSLSAFGISGALADSQLEIFSGSSRIGTNDNWTGQEVANAAAQAGAFPLTAGSFDSALLLQLQPGAYTAQVSGVAGRTGIALLELYDVDSPTPFSAQKILNVATRGQVAGGQGQLIAGFVISGNAAKKLLIRAVGPTLGGTPFNLTGTLSDPVLQIVRGDGSVVRENDNWEVGNDAGILREAALKLGAFPLTAGSRDSAMVVNLPPGTYSAQVSGVGNASGVALVEVYEVP